MDVSAPPMKGSRCARRPCLRTFEEGRRSIQTRIPVHGWWQRASSSDAAFGRSLVCLSILLLRLHPSTTAAVVKWTALETRLSLRGEQHDCARRARLARGADAGLHLHHGRAVHGARTARARRDCIRTVATLGMRVGCDGADPGLHDVCEGPMLTEEPEEEEVDAPRRCAVCDGLCDTWFMSHEQAHCSEECARKARRKRK